MATYMREPMPGGMRATCPLCIRAIKVTKSGWMARHGWKESGRKVGSVGLGFQWGECPGTGSRPLEETDADALDHLVKLRFAAKLWDIRAAEEARGRDYYDRKVEDEVGRRWGDLEVDAFKQAGLEVVKTEVVRKSKYGGYPREYETTTYRVPRGFKDRTGYVSYEKIRSIREADAKSNAEQLRLAESNLERAIDYHRNNEPDRKVEATRGSVVHAKGFRGSLCGTRARHVRTGDGPGEVTCTRCLRMLSESKRRRDHLQQARG